MTASAACLLNCIKELAEIGDSIHLLPPVILNAIGQLGSDVLKHQRRSLDSKEVLIALSISAVTNPAAEACQKPIHKLAPLTSAQHRHPSKSRRRHLPKPRNHGNLRTTICWHKPLLHKLTQSPLQSDEGFFISTIILLAPVSALSLFP